MGLQILWQPDDTTLSSRLLLCDSSRNIAEHNLRLNNRALFETAEPYQADWARNLSRYNERNVFTFDVERDVDFGGTEFEDAEAAFLLACRHCGGISKQYAVRGTGVLQLTLRGSSTVATIRFTNAIKQSIEQTLWNGILIGFHYSFACGPIT